MNSSYSIEPKDNNQFIEDNYNILEIEDNNQLIEDNNELIKNNWHDVTDTVACNTLKRLPYFVIPYFSGLTTSLKSHSYAISCFLLNVTVNLLVRKCFDIGEGEDFEGYFILNHLFFHLFLHSLQAMTYSFYDYKTYQMEYEDFSITEMVFLFALQYNNVSMYMNTLPSTLKIVADSGHKYTSHALAMILWPTTIYMSLKNLQAIYNNIPVLKANVQLADEWTLLSKLTQTNNNIFLHSEKQNSTSHKNTSSFVCNFNINNNLTSKEFFSKEHRMLTTTELYDFIPYPPKTDNVNRLKRDISIFLDLDKQGDFIIDIAKYTRKKNITNYTQPYIIKNIFPYISIIKFKNSYYFLINYKVTSGNTKATHFEELVWSTLFKDIPLNNHVTFAVKFENKEKIKAAFNDIASLFKFMTVEVDVYRLSNLNKKEINQILELVKKSD